MKTLIVYSSHSKDIKKIAKTIVNQIEDGEVIAMEQFQSSMLVNFDVFILGYGMNQNNLDEESKTLLNQLQHQRVALFTVLHDSVEAKETIKQRVESFLDTQHLLGHCLCQGRISEEAIKFAKELFG